jgi:hypothetical protein
MTLRHRRHRSVALPARVAPAGGLVGVVLLALLAAGLSMPARAAVPGSLRTASSAQAPTLSDRVRSSEDPLALRQEIDTFLDFHVGRLFGEDRAAVSQSRQMLADAVSDPASAAFKRLYADLLIDRLNRPIGSAATFNQLNAAIVIERVARATQSLRFGSLITRLAADDDASVAIWAAKAAYSVFPELLASMNDRDRQALVAALAGSVQRFPDNGALAEEVYRTLSMRTIELRPPSQAALQGGAPAIVPAVQDVIAFRVGRYAPNAPAPDPMAELPGLVVLTNNFVWGAQNDAQKMRTAAVLRDLMLQVAITANNLDRDATERRTLIDIVKRVGSAFEGISGPPQPNGQPVMPEVFSAAQTVRRMGPAANPAAVTSATEGLARALEAAFTGIPAPQLSTRPPAEQEGEEPATTQSGTQPAVN